MVFTALITRRADGTQVLQGKNYEVMRYEHSVKYFLTMFH
jgi:hypothetical protein